jgi:hypothetical protein
MDFFFVFFYKFQLFYRYTGAADIVNQKKANPQIKYL